MNNKTSPETPHLNSTVIVHGVDENELWVTSAVDKNLKEISINKLMEWLSEMKVIADGETLVKLSLGPEQKLTGAYLSNNCVYLCGVKT